MKKIIFSSLIGTFLLAGCVPANTPPMGQETLDPTPIDQSVSPSSTINDLQVGGSSYLDPSGVFSFLYPNDYTLDTQDPLHPRIYKRGETQRPQSEMSDGALIVFETINLKGKSLEEEVDARINLSTADGTTEIINPKNATTLNNYPGFTYVARGLGSSTYIYLQKNTSSQNAVVITYMVSDPKNVGYQSDVDAVLATVELIQ